MGPQQNLMYISMPSPSILHMLTELSTASSRSFHTIFHKTYSLLQTRKITPHASKSWNHFHNIVMHPRVSLRLHEDLTWFQHQASVIIPPNICSTTVIMVVGPYVHMQYTQTAMQFGDKFYIHSFKKMKSSRQRIVQCRFKPQVSFSSLILLITYKQYVIFLHFIHSKNIAFEKIHLPAFSNYR